MKYYGTVRALVDVGSWATGEHTVLQNIRKQDIMLRISVADQMKLQQDTSGEHETVVYTTVSAPNDKPVTRNFLSANLEWTIEMQLAEGWKPKWVDLMYYVVFAVSVAASLVAAWLLVAKYRHERLLTSMLPPRVIEHLVSQKQSFAEHFDNVTIFFSGIFVVIFESIITYSNIF